MTSVARADADSSCQAQASTDTSRLSIQGPCEEIWRVGSGRLIGCAWGVAEKPLAGPLWTELIVGAI